METKLQAAGSRRSVVVAVVVSCLLASMLLLHLTPSTTTAAVSLGATASAVPLEATASPWQHGRRGAAARRLLLAVQPRPSTVTNEFRVEQGTHLPAAASGKPVEVGFDASMRRFPKSGSNKNHN